MFMDLKEAKGVVFSGFLAFLLWGYEAGACLSTPDEIKLPGSSFTAERITVGKSTRKGKSETFEIRFGGTLLYHDGRCWYNHQAGQCLTQMVRGGGKSIQIDKNGQKLGVLEWDDRAKRVEVYSLAEGKKDSNLPHLKFSEQPAGCDKMYRERCVAKYDSEGCNICILDAQGNFTSCTKPGCWDKNFENQIICNRAACFPQPANANKCVKKQPYNNCWSTLTVTAHAGGRIIGKYSIRHNPSGPVARGLVTVNPQSGQGHTGVIHLGNNKAYVSNGCHVNVQHR